MVHVNNTLVSGNGVGIDDNRGTIPIALSTTPLSPPPPVAAPNPQPLTAAVTKRSRFQEVRRSLWPIPAGSPLPPENPTIEVLPPTPGLPEERTLARSKTKRKTILERIEGWWDLGLVRMDTVRGRKQPFPSSRREKQSDDDAATLV